MSQTKKPVSSLLTLTLCLASALAAQAQRAPDTRQDAATRRPSSGTAAEGGQVGRLLVVTAGRIAESPAQFYGKRVRVQAPVEEVYGKTVFTLNEDELFAGPDVLVVAPGGVAAPREGNSVVVTGTLRKFVSADIRDDYDWYGYGWYGYDWNDYNDVWVTWDSRPVIIADSVRTETGRELVQAEGGPAGAARRVYVASPGAIAAKPEAYYGHFVRSRAEVETAYGPNAFTLDEDRLLAGPDVLVLVPRSVRQAPEDAIVTVVGQVRPFNIREFERNYGWFDRELFTDQDLLDQWEQERRPVIVANSVQTQAGVELVRGVTQREAMGSPGDSQGTQREQGLGGQGRTSARERQGSGGSTRQYEEAEPSDTRDRSGRRQDRSHASQSRVQEVIAGWHSPAKKAAQAMLQKYGTPQEITSQRLIWHDTGPFKRTVVINEQIPHHFPMPHQDVLEQVVNYKVPADKFDELAQFDGSVMAERTRGELSARCDKEAANLLALNLAHEIITGKKSVDQARNAYAEAIKALMQGETPPYTQKLRFTTPTSGAGDPGKAVIQMPTGRSQQQGATGLQSQTQRGQDHGTAEARSIIITAGNMIFHPNRIQAAPGERLQVTLTNAAEELKHSLEFHFPGGEAKLPSPVPAGGQATLTIQTPRQTGEYVFYCPVGNHRQQGMEGTLVVRDLVAESNKDSSGLKSPKQSQE